MNHLGQTLRAPMVCLAWLVGANAAVVAAEPAKSKEASSAKEGLKEFLHDMLPLAWQTRPKIHFNVYTEMTPEGRRRRVPTPAQPLRYFASPMRFTQIGWSVASGEKPPPIEQLEAAMREALSANGYLAIENDHQRPDLLVVLSFGSSGTDPVTILKDEEREPNDPNPTSADVLVNAVVHDPSLFNDVIDRARFVAGDKFAREMSTAIVDEFRNRRFNQTVDHLPPPVDKSAYLPVSPDMGSPFQLFLQTGNAKTTRNLAELAFHTAYFVTATAYDFAGVENKKKIPLWQTRMAVEAQGVAMAEILKPLILTTGPYLGRETPESVMIDKRLNREGRVEIGTATVVEEPKPDATGNPKQP